MQAQNRSSRSERGTFSLSNLTAANKAIPDSLMKPDSAALNNKRITAFQLTPRIGDTYIATMDTDKFNFSNSTLVESQSLAIGYLANVGSPSQTRIFSERKEARDFIFADAYDNYITTPENAQYYNTKIPYTQALYTSQGGSDNKDERLKGTLTSNFGKRINVGADMDYIYSRGIYKNNGNKLLSYRFFGSYEGDHYTAHAYLSNFNFVNYENGGLTNDSVITHPNELFTGGRSQNDPKAYDIRYSENVWNRVRGKQYFLSHRYNFGFYRELEEKDSLGNPKKQFVPVSSIIHTMEYNDNRRRFYSASTAIDSSYLNADGTTRVYGLLKGVDDQTSYWNLRNTFALSLREGFQDWVKFGLTAFVTFDKRKFELPAAIPGLSYGATGSGSYPTPSTFNFAANQIYDEFSTYIGGELSKRLGSILTYDARGELCVVGDDIGEFRLNGNLQTTFKLFNKDLSIRAEGYIHNVTPSFYMRHFHSRYFWWDNKLDKTQQIYLGAKINLESTHTQLSAGVESIQNYVYMGKDGMPAQKNGNIQVLSARIKQDFIGTHFGWENEAAYQLSNNKEILPLPQLSLYTNLYVKFITSKVLTIQIGSNMYYYSSYYAPYYEPATQQFQLQDELKIGNYPLINAYVNFHLKQARFYIMAYNISSKFATPNYFSLPHYPLNSMTLKIGIAITLND